MRRELEWTAKRVEIRLEEAAQTIRLLPGVIPKAMLCSWPPFMLNYFELFCDDDPLPRRGSATPKEVDEMDEALLWMHWLDLRCAKVAWMRACHLRWVVIAAQFNIDRSTARRLWLSALETIAAHLNQGHTPSTRHNEESARPPAAYR